jgi:hypothetical protein
MDDGVDKRSDGVNLPLVECMEDTEDDEATASNAALTEELPDEEPQSGVIPTVSDLLLCYSTVYGWRRQ